MQDSELHPPQTAQQEVGSLEDSSPPQRRLARWAPTVLREAWGSSVPAAQD